jgi:hypothetical protein
MRDACCVMHVALSVLYPPNVYGGRQVHVVMLCDLLRPRICLDPMASPFCPGCLNALRQYDQCLVSQWCRTEAHNVGCGRLTNCDVTKAHDWNVQHRMVLMPDRVGVRGNNDGCYGRLYVSRRDWLVGHVGVETVAASSLASVQLQQQGATSPSVPRRRGRHGLVSRGATPARCLLAVTTCGATA